MLGGSGQTGRTGYEGLDGRDGLPEALLVFEVLDLGVVLDVLHVVEAFALLEDDVVLDHAQVRDVLLGGEEEVRHPLVGLAALQEELPNCFLESWTVTWIFLAAVFICWKYLLSQSILV